VIKLVDRETLLKEREERLKVFCIQTFVIILECSMDCSGPAHPMSSLSTALIASLSFIKWL